MSVSIGSGNGLEPDRCHVIPGINVHIPVHKKGNITDVHYCYKWNKVNYPHRSPVMWKESQWNPSWLWSFAGLSLQWRHNERRDVSDDQHQATFPHARGGCGAEAGGFWHSRSATAGMFTHTRSGRGADAERICHFLWTMMVRSARFRSGRGKLGVGPISCGADFTPAPPPLRDRACVNTCNDLCWSQFSARLRPRPPAHVWTYLYDCLLNRLFRRRSKKTSKLRVTGLCAGNSLVTGEFVPQRASNAENVSIWWRLHDEEKDRTWR